MTDQPIPPMPRAATVADIVHDLPIVQQIALRTAARNPLLGLVLEQAAALDEIARWASNAQRIPVEPAAPPAAPDEPVNGHAEMPTPIVSGTARKGG